MRDAIFQKLFTVDDVTETLVPRSKIGLTIENDVACCSCHSEVHELLPQTSSATSFGCAYAAHTSSPILFAKYAYYN